MAEKSPLMWVIRRVMLCLAFLCPGTMPVAAAEPSPLPSTSPQASATATPASPIEFARARLDTMLRSGHADPAWFSASFLAELPASKIDEIIASFKSSLGAYRSLRFESPKFVATFEKGTDDIFIHFDANYRIDSILFRPPVM